MRLSAGLLFRFLKKIFAGGSLDPFLSTYFANQYFCKESRFLIEVLQKKFISEINKSQNGGYMKATVFLSMVLMGLTVWGLDSLTPAYEPITWSQIEADRNKSVAWPRVMGLPINEICLTNDKIKTLKPIRSCSEWKISSASDCRNKTDWCYTVDSMNQFDADRFIQTYYKCTKPEAYKITEYSRTVKDSSCAATKIERVGDVDMETCTKFQTKYVVYPRVHSVMVTDYSSDSGSWFVKDYIIPNCK
jgi:hypothetical protein